MLRREALARLGVELLAEGVETEAQRTFLERAGCNFPQRFLVAPADFLLRCDAPQAPAAQTAVDATI